MRFVFVSLPAIMITPSMSAASAGLMNSPRAALRASRVIASPASAHARSERRSRKYSIMPSPVMCAVFRSARVAIISSSRARSADHRSKRNALFASVAIRALHQCIMSDSI